MVLIYSIYIISNLCFWRFFIIKIYYHLLFTSQKPPSINGCFEETPGCLKLCHVGLNQFCLVQSIGLNQFLDKKGTRSLSMRSFTISFLSSWFTHAFKSMLQALMVVMVLKLVWLREFNPDPCVTLHFGLVFNNIYI